MQIASRPTGASFWRHALALIVVVGPLALLLSMQPVTDPPSYHDFADRREFLGIPNFLDVASNIPFLVVGIAGLAAGRRKQFGDGSRAWVVCFAGVALVSVGSALYHLNPSADALVWDRLPMALAFSALFVAIVTDYISPRAGMLLLPAVVVGLASVIYGHGFADLRLYGWIQALPMLAVCAALLLYRPRYSHRAYLLAALVGYVLAKLAELNDTQVFSFTGAIVSGHTLKHLLGALAVWALLRMLTVRTLCASAHASP